MIMLKLKIFLLTLLMIAICNVQVNAKNIQTLSGLSKKIIERNDENLKQSYIQIYFDDELANKYPLLAQSLINFNRDEYDMALERYDDMHKMAEEIEKNRSDTVSLFDSFDVTLARADENILCLLKDISNYGGGAHGMYGFFGVNFDSQTGKQLKISDVCTDVEILKAVIKNQLKKDYPRSPFENLDSYLNERISQDDFNFTIDYLGLSFYFNPYEIGSYAEGAFLVTINFNDYPNLFIKRITQSPKNYCITLPSGDESEKILIHFESGKDFFFKDYGDQISVFEIQNKEDIFLRTLPYTFKFLDIAENVYRLPTNPNEIHFESLEPINNLTEHFGTINEDGTISFG